MTDNQVRFARLIAIGVSPHVAYGRAGYDIRYVNAGLAPLMESRNVQEMIRKARENETLRMPPPPGMSEAPRTDIHFNYEKPAWVNITAFHRRSWALRYRFVSVEDTLTHLGKWLIEHPNRRPKNYCRFIENNLRRANDERKAWFIPKQPKPQTAPTSPPPLPLIPAEPKEKPWRGFVWLRAKRGSIK